MKSLYADVGMERYAERISECSQLLGFVLAPDVRSNGDALALRLQTAKFCRVRHCPVCQWRRSLMWRGRFFKVLPKIREEYPTARWIFLTLTVQNCELGELRSTLSQMSTAWQRLSQRKVFPALGWVRSTEVTRNHETGLAHPHFHTLMLVPAGYFDTKANKYINQQRWRELWRDCLRVDYLPVVDVRTVKPKPGKDLSQDEALVVGICETLKYTTKPEDLVFSAEWLAGLTDQLHKTRAIALGGVLRQYLSEDESEEDLIHVGEGGQPVADDDPMLWFGWREMLKRYRMVKR